MYVASMNATVYAVETTSASYVYDADKRRIAKTVDSTTTKYFLDGSNVIAGCRAPDAVRAGFRPIGRPA